MKENDNLTTNPQMAETQLGQTHDWAPDNWASDNWAKLTIGPQAIGSNSQLGHKMYEFGPIVCGTIESLAQ